MRATVLVLRALGLGDLLTSVPALRALRRAQPDARLLLYTGPGLSPLAALTGAVDEVVEVRPFVLDPLPRTSVTVAVNLHGRGPQSTRRMLALRPGKLIAFHHVAVPESAAGPLWRDDEHEISRWCRLLSHYGFATDPRDLHLPPPKLPSPYPGCVIVHPGAASAARQWPIDRFAAVARELHRCGHQVVVTGGQHETDLAGQLVSRAGLPGAANRAGSTDALALAALVARAGLVICGDTGVAHLATAFETPSVVLFGPSTPAEWGPPPLPWHRALWTGRRGDPHAASVDSGLLAIEVDDVLEAVRAVRHTDRGIMHGRSA